MTDRDAEAAMEIEEIEEIEEIGMGEAGVARFPDDVVPLEGWETLAALAKALRISRQGVHQALAAGRVPVEDLRKIGGEDGLRPTYVVRTSTVEAFRRAASEAEAAQARLLAQGRDPQPQ